MGFTNITEDIVFTNVSNVEILQLFDSINESLTLGLKAADAGFSTVLGGTNSDTIVLTKFDANLTVSTGSGTDTVKTQSGDYNLSVDLGSGDDFVHLKASQWNQEDTVNAGSGDDTIYIKDIGTVVDSDFANFSSVETLTLVNKGTGDSTTTLSSNALTAGIQEFVGGKKSNDTIDAENFEGNLTINSRGGNDVITTQSGNYQLNVDAGSGKDIVSVTSEYFNNVDNIDGGSGTDTLKITGVDAVVDAAFTSTSGFEIIKLDDSSIPSLLALLLNLITAD